MTQNKADHSGSARLIVIIKSAYWVGLLIIAAMVGYIVVTLISPGDDEEVPDTGGKDVPTAFRGITVPVIP